jgi:hypothetical protein
MWGRVLAVGRVLGLGGAGLLGWVASSDDALQQLRLGSNISVRVSRDIITALSVIAGQHASPMP